MDVYGSATISIFCADRPLDLSGAPPVIYLFGLPGAGKTFVGNLIASQSDYYAYDGDIDLTPEMRRAIAERRSYTTEMRDRFYNIIIDRIHELRKSHRRLVVMQGTFKQQHRDLIEKTFEPDLCMVQVVAPAELALKRLSRRDDGITEEYASMIASFFESPRPGTPQLDNSGTAADLIQKLSELFAGATR